MDRAPDGQQAGKTSVPKFASFRPQKHASTGHGRQVKDRDASSKDEDHLKTRHEQHRHRHRSKAVHGGRRTDTSRQLKAVDTDIVPQVQTTVPQSDVFVVDRIGDPKNQVYGTLERYATSVYYRAGAGVVVGVDSGLKIDRINSNVRSVMLDTREGTGHHERPPLKSNRRVDLPAFRVKKNAMFNDEFKGARDFIYLGSARNVRKQHCSDATMSDISSSDDEHVNSRSTLGKGSSQKVSDPDLELLSESELHDKEQPGALSDQFRRTNAELTRRLDSEPDDAETWLQLIHNQDRLLGSRTTDAERRSNGDIKILIYEKALRAVRSPESRQKLLLGMMEEGAKIWDDGRLATQWSTVLKEHPHVPSLWTRFLEFKQTAFSVFRYEDVRNTYGECMKILQESRRTARDILQQKQIYETQVFVFLRMTLYMREAGYQEIAVAAWQAQLELEYFAPLDLRLDNYHLNRSLLDEKLSRFTPFWENEVLRIGEDGAQGWAVYDSNDGLPPEPRAMTDDRDLTADSLFSMWISKERQSQFLSRLPARIDDDRVENDPYRVVILSDIDPLLITSLSSDCQQILFEALLIFCQLPPREIDKVGNIHYKDGFLSNEALDYDDQKLSLGRSSGIHHDEDMDEEVLPRPSAFDFPNLQCRLDSEVLFARKGSWFSAFDSWQSDKRSSRSPIDPMFVLNVLKALLGSAIGDDLMAEYVLALELCLSPDTVRKTARKLLKKRSTSLRLYNAYALIEYRLNDASKGEGVLIAAINMSREMEANAGLDSILLWRTWTWELLNEGKSQEALLRLLTYADEKIAPFQPHQLEETTPNPTQLLRAENALTAFRDHTISFQFPTHAALSTELLLLLTYLRDPTILIPTLSQFTTSLALLTTTFPPPTSPPCELLHQSLAQLLHHHTTTHPSFSPSLIRSTLAHSIALFPKNTIFLSLYTHNERRFRIDDRVRAIISSVLHPPAARGPAADPSSTTITTTNPSPSSESLTTHFFALHTELHRPVSYGSNDRTIRATFERAVTSAVGAHCAGLWKMYFLFERGRGNWREAREVLGRGVRGCPWVKELYLLGFEYLSEGRGGGDPPAPPMGEGELRGWYDLMGEKELRVFVDLEELEEEIGGEVRERTLAEL